MRRIAIVLMWVYCFLILAGCSQNQAYIICTSCGQQVVAEAKYCSECGESIYEAQEEPVDYTILDSGYCNQNIYWEIRSDGTLFIDGNGTIPDYSYRPVDNNLAPWEVSAVSSEVNNIIIGDNITGIGGLGISGMHIENLYIGHNVISCEDKWFSRIWPRNVFIPTSLKKGNIDDIFSYYTSNNTYTYVTFYYEDSKESLQEIMDKYSCIEKIYYDYNYTVK